MSVRELKQSIEALPPEEWDELTRWIEERQAEKWDAQIEQDVTAGKLDALIAEAEADYGAGHVLPAPSTDTRPDSAPSEKLS